MHRYNFVALKSYWFTHTTMFNYTMICIALNERYMLYNEQINKKENNSIQKILNWVTIEYSLSIKIWQHNFTKRNELLNTAPVDHIICTWTSPKFTEPKLVPISCKIWKYTNLYQFTGRGTKYHIFFIIYFIHMYVYLMPI